MGLDSARLVEGHDIGVGQPQSRVTQGDVNAKLERGPVSHHRNRAKSSG
jgi:hypothetical protein